jgi:hypothetical protein
LDWFERSTAAQASSDSNRFFSIADVRACFTDVNYPDQKKHKN